MKEVATLSGVSVRTLHHYDAMGLLVPRARSESGYRLYDDADLLRLQHILVSRSLGLSLEQIRSSLDDPKFDRKASLLAQRAELARRAAATKRMLGAVERALTALESEHAGGFDMKEIFDGFDVEAHEQEVRARWGHGEAYRESRQRTAGYSKRDWATFRAEQDALYRALSAALQAGKSADDAEVMNLAEGARLTIDRWFYPCSKSMHVKLAQMYEADPRFAENIDKYGEGLTPFLVAAIRANAQRDDE